MGSVRGKGGSLVRSPRGAENGENPPGSVSSSGSGAAAREAVPPSGERRLSLSRSPTGSNGAGFRNNQERQILQEAIRDLKKRDPRVKASAARALGTLRNPAVVPVLVDAFDDGDPSVRSQILNSLAELGVPSVAALFKRALSHDENACVRLAAVRGLYRLGTIESAPAIVKALGDPRASVRRRAALCLGWMGAEEDAPNLLPLFRDEDAGVRASAIEAVGALKFRSAIPALIQALEDDDAKVREKSNHSLERITGNSFGAPPATNAGAFRKLAKKWQGWWSVS